MESIGLDILLKYEVKRDNGLEGFQPLSLEAAEPTTASSTADDDESPAPRGAFLVQKGSTFDTFRKMDNNGLARTTYTRALTLYLIKTELKLEREAVIRPIFHTLKNHQLPVSKSLVAARAASYVFQDGFKFPLLEEPNGKLENGKVGPDLAFSGPESNQEPELCLIIDWLVMAVVKTEVQCAADRKSEDIAMHF
ncbi:hypothetical protein F4810DRAFT_715077 [Camillea tinctor]|nr:hypothetical protein F4810DRAFT_715077 [Camillea tinctor]